jgi:hypothetical protein
VVKFLLLGRCIWTDADNVYAEISQFLQSVPHIAGLLSASGGIRLRIEVKQEFSPFEILKVHIFSILIRKPEMRGFIP